MQASAIAARTRTYPRLATNLALLMFLIIAASYVVNAMDRIVFPVLLPAVTREYGFNLTEGGFLSTIFTLGLGVGGIPTGFLLDRFTRKTVMWVGIAIYSIFTILTAVSIGFWDMAAYRAISGVGEAMQNAAIFTAAGAYFYRNRSLALGTLNFAYGTGSFLGPRFGAALLVSGGSWRVPLYVYGGLGMVAAILVLIALSKKFSEQLGESEVKSADLAAEAHLPNQLINRNTVIIAITSIGGGLAGFGYLGLYPTFLQTQLHFSVEDAGTAASMYGLGALLGLPAGYIADRVNQKYLNLITLAVLAVVGYSLFNVVTSPVTQDILSLLEGTASSGFLYVNNYSLMQRSVRSPLIGRASGLLVTCVYLPAALAGYFFALLQGPFGWGGAALLQLALLLIIPFVAMLLFDTSRLNVPARVRVEPVPASQVPAGEV